MNIAVDTQTQATETRQLSKVVPNYAALPEKPTKSRAKKYDKNHDYHSILKRTGITEDNLREAFGYKSLVSWRGARRRKQNQQITVNLFKLFAQFISERIRVEDSRPTIQDSEKPSNATKQSQPATK